ncbi:MBL fold metallo-hydrolase [Cupriavidus basilensis]
MSQSRESAPPAAPSPSLRNAATLLVLRDGPLGIEVLMVRRAERAGDRSSGSYVYPGGTLDAQDRRLHAYADGLDDHAASQRLGVDAGGLDFYLAAVRECFEEAGLLFARDSAGQPLALDQLEEAQRALLRDAARHDGLGLAHACAQLGLRLAVDRLAYFSHWLTPPGLPKRFDTRFFVAIAPTGQTAAHDGEEASGHCWKRPAELLDPASGLKLEPPTRRTLAAIARFGRAQDCYQHAAALSGIARIMPRLGRGEGGLRAVMPEEPCYAELGHIDPEGRGDARCIIEPGVAVRLGARIWRITARAGSDVAGGLGTNTYLVGGGNDNDNDNTWAVIDPGPDDDAHIQAVLAAAPGPIRWILSTRAHAGQAPAARKLGAATGAQLPGGELRHGERLPIGEGCTLRVCHGSGHASGHLCYLLEEERTLFTGSDTDARIDSLAALPREDVAWLAPSHGFLVPCPAGAVRTLPA